MLDRAVLLLLVAVGGSPSSDPPAPAPSALAVAPVPLRPDVLRGAWQGLIVDAAGVSRRVEVSLAEGLRRGTVFAYFTLAREGTAVTVRRLGRLVDEDLVFDLREGGRVALRLAAGRLTGDVVDPAGQIVSGRGTLELGRLRP